MTKKIKRGKSKNSDIKNQLNLLTDRDILLQEKYDRLNKEDKINVPLYIPEKKNRNKLRRSVKAIKRKSIFE